MGDLKKIIINKYTKHKLIDGLDSWSVRVKGCDSIPPNALVHAAAAACPKTKFIY